MLNQNSIILFKNVAAFFAVLLIFSCANRQLPQGGPRDRTPPKLLKATPTNSTRNFNAKEIKLEFDEFIKLNNQSTEINITPTPVKSPEYKVRKNNTLIIDLKDTLEKNTTYVINFGKAIQDVNESNTLKNFTYVFSTGIHIDSLGISGTVINNETQEHEKDVTVMLFTLKQDSLLFGKKRPTVYTVTDSSGNFSLNNLHPDNYRLYALKEKSANKIYDNDEELIAFLKKDIHLTRDTSNVQLRLFRQKPEKFRLIKRFDPDGKMFFSFNRPLNNPSLQIVYPKELNDQKIVDFAKTKDTAMLYMKNMDFDSIRVAVFENGKPLDSASLRKGQKETFQRTLQFNYNLVGDTKLKPGTTLMLTANYPIDNYETSLISLKEDSADVSNFTLTKDTSNQKSYTLKYRWKQNSNYQLVLEPGAFTDIYGDKNKRLPKRISLDKPENYSQLTLSVTVPDTAKSYIVQLLNDKKSIIRNTIIHGDSKLVYKNFITGKYNISVVYDDNTNGKWDSGSIKKKLQPENIWVSKEIITLRPNWEQESSITIPAEPATH